jgi:hypothetical protein
MVSSAPWPEELEDLVGRARCHTGWGFELVDSDWDDGAVSGPRLLITVRSVDAYHPERPRGTVFLYAVPAVTFNRAAWQRWLWDRIIDTHRHESGEAFGFVYERQTADGSTVTVMERPFAPFHGPGRDPNRNIEVGVDVMEARVTQGGGRYAGHWWDGRVVHTDAEHDERCAGLPCTPVQLVNS